jgi:Glycosyl transferases group 1
MNVLAVLNEDSPGSHPDVYEAFEDLVAEGLIDRFDVYPFLRRRTQGASDEEISGEIRALLQEGGHALIVWMHTGSLDITAAALAAIEALPQRPAMVYWEGDSYHPLYKPVPKEMLALMSRCRQVYLPCGGAVVGTLRAAGVRDLHYAPSCASATRFPRIWQPGGERTHDVVMIGNRVTSRIPFKSMPGARRREGLVRRLERRYGRRFAVYGAGWSGPSAKGPCAFDEQARVYQRATVAVGVNNSTYPLVFSNRVPIAMACGIPLVYSANPRFAEVFPDQVRATFFSTADEALALIDGLLETPPSSLGEMSLRNRAFFEANLTKSAVARFIVGRATGRGDLPSHAPWQLVPPLLSIK